MIFLDCTTNITFAILVYFAQPDGGVEHGVSFCFMIHYGSGELPNLWIRRFPQTSMTILLYATACEFTFSVVALF